MKCPACSSPLEAITVDGVTVDVCRTGCGGIWFDNRELKMVDEKHETAGQRLVDLEIEPTIKVDYSQRRYCAKCENQIMLRHFMSEKREVAIDECPKCGSIFLDYGELGQIRNQFDTEAERKQAFDVYFESAFGSQVAEMKRQSEEELRRAQKFAHALRFICPSYYIPGKQQWGAF